MEKREPSYTVGGNVNWFNLWGTIWRLLKKLKLELTYDPAIPLLGKHSDKTIKRYMHPNVNYSIIYNSQDMEAT